jgi:hypothetical protein
VLESRNETRLRPTSDDARPIVAGAARSASGAIAAAGTVLLGLGLALGGCARQDIAPANQNPASLQSFVADAGIAPRLGAAPSVVVRLWWQRLQFRQTDLALSLMTPAARRTLPAAPLALAAQQLFGWRLQRTSVEVVRTWIAGDRATAWLRLRTRQPIISPDHVQVLEQTPAVGLVRRRGSWAIANADFLAAQLRQWRRAQQRATPPEAPQRR